MKFDMVGSLIRTKKEATIKSQTYTKKTETESEQKKVNNNRNENIFVFFSYCDKEVKKGLYFFNLFGAEQYRNMIDFNTAL